MCNFILQLLWVDLFFWFLFYSLLLSIYKNEISWSVQMNATHLQHTQRTESHAPICFFEYTINQKDIEIEFFLFFLQTHKM